MGSPTPETGLTLPENWGAYPNSWALKKLKKKNRKAKKSKQKLVAVRFAATAMRMISTVLDRGNFVLRRSRGEGFNCLADSTTLQRDFATGCKSAVRFSVLRTTNAASFFGRLLP